MTMLDLSLFLLKEPYKLDTVGEYKKTWSLHIISLENMELTHNITYH